MRYYLRYNQQSSLAFQALFHAWVAISEKLDEDSQGRRHYSQNLHTPTEEYVILEATNEDKNVNFVLPEKGSLWVRLAFQEAYPELSKSFRKVAGYKTYNKKTGNYQYLAVYVYDLAALKKEVKEGMKLIEEMELINKLNAEFEK
jgi:hypothetical protein